MTVSRKTVSLGFVAATLVAALLLALTLGANGDSTRATAASGPESTAWSDVAPVKSGADLEVFAGTFEPTKAQASSLAALKSTFVDRGSPGSFGSIDISKARPAAMPGSDDSIWIVPNQAGDVCAFVPNNGGGFGASCASPAELNGTGLIFSSGVADQANGPMGSQKVVVVVQPDGAAAPAVRAADGKVRLTEASKNVTAILASGGEKVIVNEKEYGISEPIH